MAWSRPGRTRAVAAALLAAGLACRAAAAGDGGAARDSLRFELDVRADVWCLLAEQVESGQRQAVSLDPADGTASGFEFRQGRIGLSAATADGRIETALTLRLEERADLLDGWIGWRPAAGLQLRLGQQKIPTTAEALQPDTELDFALRSVFAARLGDLALARTPYISSVMAAKSWDRDLGLAALVEAPAAEPRLRLLAMLGNGLGAGRSVGASERPGFLFANGPADRFAAARLELRAAPGTGRLRLGVHGSLNRHRDASLDARGPVFDLDRRSGGVDVEWAPRRGLRCGGFCGAGRLEDGWGGQRYRYEYRGHGQWGLWAPGAGRFELALRRDEFRGVHRPAGEPVRESRWTCGVNWRPEPNLRLQLNAVRKTTAGPDPDPDDDLLLLNVQTGFRLSRVL